MKTIETNSEARARVIHARQSRMNEVIHDFVETGTVNVTSLAQVPLADCPPRYQWLVNTILAGTDTSPVSDEPARRMRAVLRAYISTGKVLPLAYSPAFGNHPRLADLQDFLLQQHTLGGNDSMNRRKAIVIAPTKD